MALKHGDLLELATSRRVIVVDAATGSGKSTLVPLCLAEQCAAAGRGCRIVVTQPRRLAAKGLAKRVSQQTGTAVGSIAGYRVGRDKQDFGAPIVYVTAGHLLEALVHNPSHLGTFSHVVLDEVHERFIEADFLMALLRMSLSRPETVSVRVVVMSATLQQTLGNFFQPLLLPAPAGAAPGKLSLPGATPFEVRDIMWEDIRSTWPGVFVMGGKEPNFLELRPSRARLLPSRRRSEQLTKMCKDVAPFCARLLCGLSECGYRVALVFVPGLDQMRDVQEALEDETRKKGAYGPKVFLMHSALEEETYKQALDPTPEGEWRVVLATNIAESSLTVPGVSAVLDFGLHRVNIYDDDVRMSMLATEWCCKASMRQRRGRTGRTNAGVYVRLFPSEILEEISDFDDSGVERAPLARTALEAAHLAQLLGNKPLVRAGLPVEVPGGGLGRADFWDGRKGGWRVTDQDEVATHLEEDLTPLPIDANLMLSLLPAPPREDRVLSAMAELHELGALAVGDTPSVMGSACLKLSVDVPLGRLVVLGWALGFATDAIILAAALALAPHCDILKTPFNTNAELSKTDTKTLRQVVETRQKMDAGTLSEPLTVYNFCMDWLRVGGGHLGRVPNQEQLWWRHHVNTRLWTTFTEKVIELTEGLLRLLPPSSPSCAELSRFLQLARGKGAPKPPTPDPRHLAALLTWGLAPLGFVAVGQTPALYTGSEGAFCDLSRVVKKNAGSLAHTVCWPKVQPIHAKEVASYVGCQVQWTDTYLGETYVGVTEQDSSGSMDRTLQFLCRICGPFNGKETFVATHALQSRAVKPPRHPCVMNWYMPKRDGRGVLEVRVNWKSQAETLIQVPCARDRTASCRPKRLLVAAGGEYGNRPGGGGRIVILRGSTVLPAEDGGRSSLLWLLAAGVPRDAKFVAMAAPCGDLAQGDFEVRALRLWQRTLRLPPGDPLTSSDLRAVNAFRSACLEMQRRKPHRLAGPWCVEATDQRLTCECVVAGDEEMADDALVFSSLEPESAGARAPFMLVSDDQGIRWLARPLPGAAEPLDVNVLPGLRSGSCQEEPGGLRWGDGSFWKHQGSTDSGPLPVLEALSMQTVERLREAASTLLSATSGDPPPPPSGPRWLPRLVPVHPSPDVLAQQRGCPAMVPFNLEAVEAKLAEFSKKLGPGDTEDLEAEDGLSETGLDPDSEEDDAAVDVSQEALNEEYMWRLAEDMATDEWGPSTSRQLCFVESAIALPPMPICVECNLEGKTFSKSQRARHPDDRRCQDCVQKFHEAQAAARGAKKDATLNKLAAIPAYAIDPSTGHQAAVCSICRVLLSKSNCTSSQRQKEAAKRRCNDCVGGGGAAAPVPVQA